MREQGSEAWQRGKRETTGAAKRGREKDGKYRRDQERPREGRRKGKQDRKREHDRERGWRGETTAGKSRYVRVTSYTRYTCVQRKARVSARVMCVRVYVCARARARVMRAYVRACAYVCMYVRGVS